MPKTNSQTVIESSQPSIVDVIIAEKKRVDLLDNAIAAVLKEHIVTDESGNIKVDLKPSDLSFLATAQEKVNNMRRRNAGIGE